MMLSVKTTKKVITFFVKFDQRIILNHHKKIVKIAKIEQILYQTLIISGKRSTVYENCMEPSRKYSLNI